MEILVGIDGSEHGTSAARWAAGEARTLDCPLTLVHVYSVPAVPSPAGPVRMPEQRKTAAQHAQAVMDHAELAVRELLEGSGVPVSTVVVEGPPIATLLTMAEGSRMLVLGSHSGAVFRHRLGSVVGACLHKASCPVVVVPGEVAATVARSRSTTASSS